MRSKILQDIKIIINGLDQTELFNKNLLLLTIAKYDSIIYDTLYIAINNKDLQIQPYSLYSVVNISYKGFSNKEEIVTSTFYIINDEKFKSNEDLSIIRYSCRSMDLRNATSVHSNEFKNRSLKQVLTTLTNSLNIRDVVIDKPLESIPIKYFLQHNNTSTNTIRELAEIFYAVANIRNNKLFFLRKGIRKTGPAYKKVLHLHSKPINVEWKNADLGPYQGVEYSYWNENPAHIITRRLGNTPFLELPKIYCMDLAYTYACTKYNEIKEDQTISFIVSGIKHLIPGDYLVIDKDNSNKEDIHVNEIKGSYLVKENVINCNGEEWKTLIEALKLD